MPDTHGDGAYRLGKPTLIIDPRLVLRMIGGVSGYRKFVQEGLGEGHKEEYYEVEDQRFLGKQEFSEELRREFDQEEGPKKRRPLAEVVSQMARA